MEAILPIIFEYVSPIKDIQRKIEWCKRPPDDEENPFEIDEMPVFIQKRWCHHYIIILFVLFKSPKRVLAVRRIQLKLYNVWPGNDCIFV